MKRASNLLTVAKCGFDGHLVNSIDPYDTTNDFELEGAMKTTNAITRMNAMKPKR